MNVEKCLLLVVVLAFLGLLCGCSDDSTTPPDPDRGVPAPDAGVPDAPAADRAVPDARPDGPGPDIAPQGLSVQCPGSTGCTSNSGALQVGVAKTTITPPGYEVARVAYLEEESSCPAPTPKAPFGLTRCGALLSGARSGRKDCGTDGVCQGDNIKTRLTCGSSKSCPTGLTCNAKDSRCYLAYVAPDADGSEGDGAPDWFVDCGRDGVCPCLDGSGAGAYYGGKGSKACLTGYTKNPKYSAPDADGSEGNGAFEGVWIAGFSPGRPALGKHDDLWARAMVFRSGETTAAVLSLDLVGLFFDDVERIRDRVNQKLGQGAVDYVLVSSTHNHEGPDTMGQWGPTLGGIPVASGVDKKYLSWMLDRAAQAVVAAAGALEPATLEAGQVQTPRQGYVRDSRDPRIYDLTLVALRASAASSGKTLGTLVSWGNHPEVLSDQNNYLTSDFAHPLREAMENKVPAEGSAPELPALGGVSVYVQGAVGCLMTPLGVSVTDRAGKTHSSSGWDKNRALGVNVAVQARKALSGAAKLAAPAVSIFAKKLLLPAENTLFHVMFKLGLMGRKAYGCDITGVFTDKNLPKLMTEVAVVRVGPVTFFSLPGEADPETLVGGYDGSQSFGDTLVPSGSKNPPDLNKAPKGPYLKARVPGTYKVTVGLGNDEVGYLVPPWNFQLGKPPYLSQADGDHYEETNSLGPKTVTLVLAAYDELLKAIK